MVSSPLLLRNLRISPKQDLWRSKLTLPIKFVWEFSLSKYLQVRALQKQVYLLTTALNKCIHAIRSQTLIVAWFSLSNFIFTCLRPFFKSKPRCLMLIKHVNNWNIHLHTNKINSSPNILRNVPLFHHLKEAHWII